MLSISWLECLTIHLLLHLSFLSCFVLVGLFIYLVDWLIEFFFCFLFFVFFLMALFQIVTEWVWFCCSCCNIWRVCDSRYRAAGAPVKAGKFRCDSPVRLLGPVLSTWTSASCCPNGLDWTATSERVLSMVIFHAHVHRFIDWFFFLVSTKSWNRHAFTPSPLHLTAIWLLPVYFLCWSIFRCSLDCCSDCGRSCIGHALLLLLLLLNPQLNASNPIN